MFLLFNKQTFSWDGLVIERSIDTNATLIKCFTLFFHINSIYNMYI